MDSTLALLKRLTDQKVEFVIIGGLAGVAHGSALVTEDVDVCAPLTEANVARIIDALAGLNPRWRMRPDRPPLADDVTRLRGMKNLYLVTDAGQFDVLGSVTGVGEYHDVERQAVRLDLGGITCRVLGLDALIRSKTAMGRAKDRLAATELEAIRARTRKQHPSDP